MQNGKTNEQKRRSRKGRSHPLPGKQRAGQNGSAKAGPIDGAGRGFGFHLLAKDLRTMALFELALRTGDDKDNREAIRMINTEAKQLQAIEDLYKIVRAQPKYERLKEPDWQPDTLPVTILYWLLRKLGPLAGGNRWTVDTYRQGENTRYRFVIYKYYHSQHVRDESEFIPLDFLPYLKKRDQPLHNLIIDIVSLVSRENKVPLWDEDGDFSEGLKALLSHPISGNETLDRQKCSYASGPAAEYLKLIKSRRKKVSAWWIEKNLVLYNANSERKRIVKRWIDNGMEMAATKQCITKNTFIPGYVRGNPVTPFRMYKFVWSLHDNDYVKTKAFNKLKKDDNIGSFIPLMFSIAKPGQQLPPINEDDFPELMDEFMRDGLSLFLGRYRDYFYKRMLDDQKTPSETLLQVLEKQEVKDLANE